MGQSIDCDICEKTVGTDRIVIQHPTAWQDIYDICDGCWDKHFEPVINAVAHKRPAPIQVPEERITPFEEGTE